MFVVLSPCLILVSADLEVAGPGAAVPHVRGGDGAAVEPLHVAHHIVQAPGRDGALPPPPRRPGDRQRVSCGVKAVRLLDIYPEELPIRMEVSVSEAMFLFTQRSLISDYHFYSTLDRTSHFVSRVTVPLLLLMDCNL